MKAVTAGMLLLLAPIGAALAQDASSNYPNKTVRMIIPFAPGGATDVLGRIVAQKLYERWGQVVIADNRVGASGNIGAEFVAKAAQDWIAAVGAKTAYIAPGSPWENGFIESFNARLREIGRAHV